MLLVFSHREGFQATGDARLTLELFHDIQKLVVNFWPLPKPVLDEIQVGEGVGDVERSSCAVCHCRGLRQHGQLGVLADALDVHGRVKGRTGWLGTATLEMGRSKSRDLCDTVHKYVRPGRCNPLRNLLTTLDDRSFLQHHLLAMPPPPPPPGLSPPFPGDFLVPLSFVMAALAQLNIKISTEDLRKGMDEEYEARRAKFIAEAQKRKSALAPHPISDN